MGDSTHSDGGRTLILILPKTFFDQSFLLPFDNSPSGFKVTNSYRFIANTLIEVTAGLPENTVMAATSLSAFDSFGKELEKKSLATEAKEVLALFRNMVVIVPTESMNALNEVDSMIALADRMGTTSCLDPVIVIHPKSAEKYRRAIASYYGTPAGKPRPSAQTFRVLEPAEAKVLLEVTFPEETRIVLTRTAAPFNIF